MAGLRFSICIPTYNAAVVLREAIGSILRQSFSDYEIIVGDDNSSDDTEEVVRGFDDPRIRYFRNRDNVGYGKNMQLCAARARHEILFLMGHDDILLKDALMKTRRAFERGPEIGAVTRPYYWFDSDVLTPVRAIRPFDPERDTVLSIFDGEKAVRAIFDSVGQLSGLGYRREYLDTDFHEEIFPSHIYPFASIAKKHRVVYLKDYTVAVRIGTSMTIHRPQTYDISPTESWVRMFKTVYREKPFKNIQKQGIRHITTHFLGLIQLRNYAGFRIWLREVALLTRYRPLNLLDARYWFFVLGTLALPARLLIPLVSHYKKTVLSRKLRDIVIEM